MEVETVYFLVEDDVHKDQSKGLMYEITCAFFFRLTLVLCVRWDIHISGIGLSPCFWLHFEGDSDLQKHAVFMYCGTLLHWLRHRTRLDAPKAF